MYFSCDRLLDRAGRMVIAIIGGGATGAVFGLHLTHALRRRGGVEILVIEPADVVGRGVAYATGDPRHLLNVRVSNMSAFADRPDHLLEWLEREGQAQGVLDPTPFSFIPRGVYGAYLAELTQKLFTSGTISHVRDHCIDLVERAESVELTLASGDKMIAELAVLATGNDPKPALPGIPSVQAWGEGALTGLSSDALVLMVGTGLTMVDMVLSLDRLGHRGLITAVSPHGSLSMPHRPSAPMPLEVGNIPFGVELSELTSWLRALCDSVQRENGDWRSVIDALRPHTQRLWRSMSLVQRRRFLRHARSYWDIHRHRMAPQAEQQIGALHSAGRLEIVAGRVICAKNQNSFVTVELSNRKGVIEKRNFARVIDCTGLTNDPLRTGNPLIQALLARGIAQPDPLGIGLDVNEEYALIDRWSRPSARVRAIGPVGRAAFWECIAIPDIRQQCIELAEQVALAWDSSKVPVRTEGQEPTLV
jgi:uncharacterized NAD(P)/FAD-binding protein YdhS